MLPKLHTHDQYINFTNKYFQNVTTPKTHDDILPKLKLLDLTPIRLLTMPFYSKNRGRPSFAPEDMMRTYIAMVLCRVTSPTEWVNNYLEDKSGFYAIISGFHPGDTPSIGCMYNFIRRILNIPKYYRDNNIRSKKKRLTRTQKKNLKEDKEKISQKHIKITAKLAKRFQRLNTEGNPYTYIPHAEKIINEILLHCCINKSQLSKLLDLDHLNVSGDGSKLKAHSSPYGKKICNCDSSFSNPCDCKRFYNSPDASWGYDSYRDCYVFSYNLYQLNSFNFDNKCELPIYLMMVTGARHDSVTGMYSMQRATQTMGYHIDNGCFDAAHDTTDFYRMSRDVWEINPFIPLNKTNQENIKNLPMSSIINDGIPVCQSGYQMYYSGHEKDRDRVKWRCPIKASKKNQNLKCSLVNVCSSSAYGRVVYTHPKDNPRLYTPIPRTSTKWQDIYDHRTSAERVFKREKNDFKLTSFKTRSKERLLFYALLTAIAVHVDTWYRIDNSKSH